MGRTKIFAIILMVGLAIPTAMFLFWFFARPAAVVAYFKFETAWTEHWPAKTGKWALQRFVPVLSRNGMLPPVRVQVEPRASFLLDPRDLVSATILRTGSWQPEIWQSLSSSLGADSELNLSRVDAIKIDVEGAEVSVLREALKTLNRFHPKIVVEVIASQLASFQTTPEDLDRGSNPRSRNVDRGRKA